MERKTLREWLQAEGKLSPDVIAIKIGNDVIDLLTPVDTTRLTSTTVTPLRASDPEGLRVLRHSAAHVMADAVQKLFPGTKVTIGPAIEDGFYYDFSRPEGAFSEDDLKKIEKAIAAIIKSDTPFRREVVSRNDALALFEKMGETFKVEIIKAIPEGEEISLYKHGTHEKSQNYDKDWVDVCEGPHVPRTGALGAVKLMSVAGAYWRGDEKNPMLQRIYGTAWPTKEQLQEYKDRLAEAERRDHRRLGEELDLFSFPKTIGPGLPVFHPKGGIILREMENYVRERHIAEGFQYVKTPHLSKEDLFYTSGHLPYYADGMFPPMEEESVKYRLKAMNCPMHNEIFRSRGRSYRELPLRFFEMGHDYRYEKSGVVHGLTRMRGFTQDDSHTYCTREQAPAEIKKQIEFFISILQAFGLNDFYLELSTRATDGAHKDKFIGSDEDWETATRVLEDVCTSTGLDLVPDPGGAAFYGPKVSVQARDAIGRTWQMSTIQYDFNQPERFGLEFQASDGSRQQPVMIHSAKFGSIERFIGVLVEHYAGAFPVWLAPTQVLGVPVAEEFDDYLKGFAAQLRQVGIRVDLDTSNDRFGKKIRNATQTKVPFIVIAGGEDRDGGTVSFRFRDGSQLNGVPRAQAVDLIKAWDQARRNDSPDSENVRTVQE